MAQYSHIKSIKKQHFAPDIYFYKLRLFILMLHLNTQTALILTAILLAFTAPVFAQTLTSPADGATDISLSPELQWAGTSGNATVEIFDCNTQTGSVDLGNYQLAQGPITISGIPDDLSGVTYNSLTNTLFMVTNKQESIYETDLNGNLLRTIVLEGTQANNVFYDIEDIVHISGNTFALVEERKGRVAIIDILPGTTYIEYSSADLIQMSGNWSFSNNSGLEGITYDPATGQFYVIKEKQDKILSTFNMPSSFPVTLGAVSNPCDLESYTFDIMTDVSAIHHLGLTSGFSDNDILDNFLILSDESEILVETDGNCQIISSLNVPVATNEKPEGVTMDNNGNLYIVAEPNKLYIYTNNNQPTLPIIHSATVSGNSYTVPLNILQNSTEYCWRVTNNSNISTTFSFTTGNDGYITVSMPISTGADDVEEWQDGSMYINSSDLELIYDTHPNRLKQKTALRFNDMFIPQAAQIVNAHVQFTTDEASSGTVNLTIHGEAADDASPFTTANNNLSNRPTTAASVSWSPPNWQTVGERSTRQKTPDLSNIIQEVVDRPNYNANSSMAFIFSGNGTTRRIAESYDGAPAEAAELHVTYNPPAGGEEAICIEPKIHIWLEAADVPSTGLMQTGLRDNYILPGQNTGAGNANPSGQPYYQAPWQYPGLEGYEWGNNDYHSDVVDWVIVSFRTAPAAATEVVKATALLHKDGSIHFPESCVIPTNLKNTPLYVVVDHRNHLVAMSHTAVPINNATVQNLSGVRLMNLTYDFRQQDSYRTATSTGQKQLQSGTWAMIAGDMDNNYDINGADKIIWSQENGTFGFYKAGDLNLNGDVNGADKAPWEANSGISSGVPQ